jgi:outer membrane protein
MRRTLTTFSLVAAVVFSIAAFAQNGKAAGSPATSTAAPPSVAPPTKVGIINIQQAILASNEGRRDFETLSKKYAPKQDELQRKSTELEDLKKQLNTQGDKLSDDARAKLVKQIDTKQRDLQHDVDAAQADFQGEQNDLANRIGSKVMQVLDKFAKDNSYAVILDVSNPQTTPVLWADMRTVDVTEAIVNAYNVQSGVPAPAPSASRPPATGAPGANKPAAPATAAPGTAAPPRPKPTTTTPPKQ